MSTHATYRRIRTMDDIFLPVALAPSSATRSSAKRYGQVFSVIVVMILMAFSFGVTNGVGGMTLSYFRDVDFSKSNVFQAGFLGFRVQAEGDGYTFDGPEDEDGGFHTSFVIPESGSLPMQYEISVEKTGGSDVFCNALHASATSTSFMYDGPLLALATTTFSNGPFDFNVTISDTDALSDGDTCLIDVVYTGWSSDTPVPFGYTDTKRTPLTFTYSNPSTPSAPVELASSSAPEVTDAPPADPTSSSTPDTVVEPSMLSPHPSTVASTTPPADPPAPDATPADPSGAPPAGQ